MAITAEENIRYQRQIMIPEIGLEGQERIKNSSVFILGLGGLGSTAAYNLAAAGVGGLTIVDRDRVELGNLNRQIIHNMDDIGKLKIDSAMEKLRRLNPGCRIHAVAEEVTEDNVTELVGSCSVIIDGTDNMKARKALNKASVQKNIPFILGGVEGFNGMVTTFVPPETACFECVFPPVKSREKIPGVIGALPGMVASIQVLEVLKFILGMEDLLKNKLLFIQGSDMTVKTVNMEKNLNCKVCNTTSDLVSKK